MSRSLLYILKLAACPLCQVTHGKSYFMGHNSKNLICTVKLGDKERFDKEQIGVKEPFPVLHKDKKLFALRNNFRVTKKFFIAKFDW